MAQSLRDEMEAKAQLRAAAPDLLEALKVMQRFAKRHPYTGLRDARTYADEEGGNLVKLAEAAIAKATGQS